MANNVFTFAEAIREGLKEEMRRDKSVFLMGEDIHISNCTVTRGLIEEFEDRMKLMPISENGFCAAGVGASVTGMRPVVEIMYGDFVLVAADAICNQAAKLRYMSAGQYHAPVTYRVSLSGMGGGAGAHHSQSLEALPLHFPGLKLVYPSTPYDAKGLIKSAIRDEDPVLFYEHKLLYPEKQEITDEEYLISLGKGIIRREGKDLTLVSYGKMAQFSLEAAEELAKEENIDIEVYDPRTLRPFDYEQLLKSVEKTGRLVIVEEDTKIGGVGAEIAARVAEEALFSLEAPIKRIAGRETPAPAGKYGHSFVVPTKKQIKQTIKDYLS
jgi:pyruvate/2-oxoglutarate/acetoin dehydrogenase E1 component